jgi:hypothetical protein
VLLVAVLVLALIPVVFFVLPHFTHTQGYRPRHRAHQQHPGVPGHGAQLRHLLQVRRGVLMVWLLLLSLWCLSVLFVVVCCVLCGMGHSCGIYSKSDEVKSSIPLFAMYCVCGGVGCVVVATAAASTPSQTRCVYGVVVCCVMCCVCCGVVGCCVLWECCEVL